MTLIRAMVVDDEEPARDRLRGLLEQIEDVRVVGEARDGDEAIRCIPECRPNLVFLDIEMPGPNGIAVAATIPPPRPSIVFCTAYDHYAIEAFEQHAAGYLLKPVTRRRLSRALDQVRGTLEETATRRGQVRAATEVQARLLPQRLPELPGLEIAGRCRPAQEVGGDTYDFVPLENGALGISVADVSGKGLFAGLLMAGLQARIQSIAPRHGTDVGAMVAELNRLLHESTETQHYASLFYGVYDPASRRLHYVNAGHPPALVLRDQRLSRLEPTGTVIGLLDEAEYDAAIEPLAAGDVVVLYTDGVVEAESPRGDEFGTAGLANVVQRHRDVAADRICDTVLAELDRFADGAPLRDDATLVIAKVMPT